MPKFAAQLSAEIAIVLRGDRGLELSGVVE